MDQKQLLMTEAEAAVELRMSPRTLRNQRVSGYQGPIVPFRRIGGSIRYHRGDIEAWQLEQMDGIRLSPSGRLVVEQMELSL